MSKKDEAVEKIRHLVRSYIETRDTHLFLINGGIYKNTLEPFMNLVVQKSGTRPNASLFLTTFGGDPHAAYRASRCLQRHYESVRVLVTGPCKSAGTLLAIGAQELALGEFGELGPLDVQLTKPDELVPHSSGLDTLQAYTAVQQRTYSAFEAFLLETVDRSDGSISTKTAAELACQLVRPLIEPIAGQVDPHRLGEVERFMSIAQAYGERLNDKSTNLKERALYFLVRTYPSHDFVIDLDEAKKLFNKIGGLDDDERALAEWLGPLVGVPKTTISLLDFEGFAQEDDENDSGDDETEERHDESETDESARNSELATEGTEDPPTPGPKLAKAAK